MKSFYSFFLAVSLFVCCNSFQTAYAGNNPVYEQRRHDYIDSALAHFSPDAITLQAYKGVPLDSVALQTLLTNISTSLTSDFDIVKLIRVLYFTNGAYDAKILPVLNQFPYWLHKNEVTRNYWSENHMIMWMSSDWLLHEKYGRAVDANLDNRLRHYLRLKVKYGFYEFFSSVYSPYCLSGLINLADFAQDAEIKSLATQASQILLRDLLLITNDKGVFFPTAGRNYPGKYESAYGQNHNNLIYLLTGMGQTPGGASHAGGFLASSTLSIDTVTSSWSPTLDTLYYNGHTIDSGLVLNSGQYFVDKVIFQWSSGAYFHPKVSEESATLIIDSNLWQHPDFAPFKSFSTFSVPTIVGLSNTLTSMSESTVICGENIAIYKHHGVTLSSVQDFWKGKLGYQEHPCVANVGTTAVYTGSGKIFKDWDNRNPNNANDNLPYVSQKHNIALLMYRPEPKPSSLGFNNPEVALHWKDADFDEMRNDSMWLLGRQGNGYIGVRRACLGQIDSVRGCYMDHGQTWVIMVGDSDTYGSFNNFQNSIHNSQFQETWSYDSAHSQEVYYAKIVVDTTTIEYAWRVDSTVATGIEKVADNNANWSVYPNPANDYITVSLNNAEEKGKLEIYNITGELVAQSVINDKAIISTQNMSDGMYAIKWIPASGGATVKRFVVSH